MNRLLISYQHSAKMPLSIEEKQKKWLLLGKMIKQSQNSNETVDFDSLANVRNDSVYDSDMQMEEIFGAFLITLGSAAAIANLLVLIAVIKHLKYRNPLFLIITNFAFIDEFKAMCAIYMGVVLVEVFRMKPGPESLAFNPNHNVTRPNLLVFKMLQTSVFMMYFGNLCSVFNLILATVNEFLYIRVPFWYRKMMTRGRVIVAIILIWMLAFCFSMAKAIHGGNGYGNGGGQIWVPINRSDIKIGPRRHDADGAATSEIYTLILLLSLLLCLMIVGVVYANLYLTVRRANRFRRSATVQSNRSRSTRTSQCTSPVNIKRSGSSQTLRKEREEKETQILLMNHQAATEIQRNNGQIHDDDNEARQLSKKARKVAKQRHVQKRLVRRMSQPRLFKRYKCILVILIVCAVHFVFLSIYFTIQLLHFINIQSAIQIQQLRSRFLVNFILRALFVLHASLNPFIFFRIRSFRVSFLQIFKCCLKEESFSHPYSYIRKVSHRPPPVHHREATIEIFENKHSLILDGEKTVRRRIPNDDNQDQITAM